MSFLKPHHIEKVAKAYHEFVDEPLFSKVATIEDVAKHDYRLSIPLYVKPAVGNGDSEDEQDLLELWESWEEESVVFWEELDGLVTMLDNLNGGKDND
jgi:type I restriction enzyme M protein